MKPKSIFSIIIMMLATTMAIGQTVRQEQSWNTGWKFALQDNADAKNSNFNDKAWRNVTLPHDWSIEGTFYAKAPMGNEGGYLPDGIGWYRKTLNMQKAWLGKQVMLCFDGVYMDSKVFVNGTQAGCHYYGYTPFVIDITENLKLGKNLIAVRVDNSAQKNSRWYSGSGIYRKVKLIVCDQTHIAPWGIAVTTPKVGKENATVNVRTEIKNEGTTSKTITVKASVVSVDASPTISDITLKSGETQVVSQQLTINNPKLWSTESPNLYEAKVEIIENNKVIDQKKETFGVRSIEYDAQNGLRINGEKTLIYGGCAHHDNGMLGAATFTNAEYRKVRLMKNAGFNLVRTSHNPPSEDFFVLATNLVLWSLTKLLTDGLIRRTRTTITFVSRRRAAMMWQQWCFAIATTQVSSVGASVMKS